MKKLLFVFIALGVVFGVHGSAFAELKLEKNIERVDITPGQTTTGVIEVKNTSNEEITAKVYIEDLQYVAPFDGTRKALPLGSTPYSLGKFMTVDSTVLKVPANGSQKVTYTIKAPKNAKGGYYGVVFFERVSSAEGIGVGIILRYGYKLLAESKDKIQDVALQDMEASQDILTGLVLNTGNVLLFSNPMFSVIDAEGMVLDRGEVAKELTLPPQEKAAFKVALSKEIPAGNYTLLIDFNLMGAGALTKEIDFSKDSEGNIKNIRVKG